MTAIKRVVLALAVVVLYAMGSASAQSLSEMGAKGGFAVADVHGSDATNMGEKFGPAVAAFAGIDINRQVRLQPELWYVEKGTKTDEGDDDYKIKLAYLELPVLLRWMIPRESALKPSLFVGGAVAYNLSANVKGVQNDQAVDCDAKDFVEDLDFSVIVGGGLDVVLGSGRVVTDVRYTLGLTSFWNHAADAPLDFLGDDVDLKNGALSITIGYAVLLGE